MDRTESDELSRSDIVDAEFGTKMRGADRDEVRVHLGRLADLIDAQRGEIAALRDDVQADRDAPVDLEDAADTTAVPLLDLGDEELRARIDDEAQRVLDDAHSTRLAMLEQAEVDAADIRAAAEQLYAERSVEADALVEQRREESAEVGADELAQAHAEAERLVNEAQIVRRQILEDLARRRTSARRQIEQLRAGRERLIASHDIVRRALDEVTEELGISMSEARAAAETAGYTIIPSSPEEIETEIETARLSGLLDTGSIPVVTEDDSPATESSAEAIDDAPDSDGSEPSADDHAATASDAGDESISANVETEPADGDADALAAVVDIESARPDVDTKGHPAAHKKSSPKVRSIGVGELPGRPAVDDEVHDLFAQIRSSADGDDDGSPHPQSKRRTPAAVPPAHAGDDTVSLAAIERVMGRVLKRELADEQSSVLAALSAGGDSSLVALLGVETDQKDRYWNAVEPHAADALAAGRPGEPTSGPPLVTLRSHVDALVADLRVSVSEVLDDSGPDDDRIPALRRVYRQTKTTHIGDCVTAITTEVRSSDPATR